MREARPVVSEASRKAGMQQGDGVARENVGEPESGRPPVSERGRERRRPARRRGSRAILLPQLLGTAVERNPSAPAVMFEDRSWTYAEIDADSSRLARALIDRGLGPEDIVEVSLDGPANVMLLDTCNFESYRRGESFKYHGGLAKASPIRVTPPHQGKWHVVIDLGGFSAKVRAGIRVLQGVNA